MIARPLIHRTETSGRPRAVLPWFAAWLALICLSVAPALAQDKSEPPSISLRLPFELPRGRLVTMPAERFLPLVYEIGPGDAGGILQIEYRQDATQEASIIVPFAATPGKTTLYPVVAALPLNCEEITVSMFGRHASGRSFSRQTRFRGAADLSRSDQKDLPFMLAQGGGSLFAIAGETSLLRVDDAFSADQSGSKVYADLVQIEPALLPKVWLGYDSFRTLVLRVGDEGLDDVRVQRAVIDWVTSGGRLVLIADRPGSAWRRWLPEGAAGEFIELREPSRIDLPLQDLGDAVPSQAVARAATLTDWGRRNGWTTTWDLQGSAALLAQGPVGFGFVTVLGIEPAASLPVLPPDELKSFWRTALHRDYAAWQSDASGQSPMPMGFRHYAAVSGATSEEQRALSSSLDGVARVPPISGAIFLLIAAAMAGLALMLGPGDAFILKRLNARHRSWATAILWIALASVAAYMAPRLLRTGASHAGSESVVDLIASPSGATSGWRTSTFGVFASSAGKAVLAVDDERSWWRGVSSLYAGSSRATLRPFHTTQDATDPRGGGLPVQEASPLTQGPPLSLALWTYRALMEFAPTDGTPADASPLTASITQVGDEWDISVSGLPAGATVELPRIYSVDDAGLRLTLLQDLTVEAGVLRASADPARDSRHLEESAANIMIPGAAARNAAINARVRSGHWALLEFWLKGAPPPAAIEGIESSHTSHMRILIPIPAAESPDD